MPKVAKKAAKRSTKEVLQEPLDELEPIDLDDDTDDGLEDEDELDFPTMEASDLATIVRLPKAPGSNVEFHIGMEWINKVCNEEQRNGLDIYIYRAWPRIMRELDSSNITADGECPKYIDVITYPYTKLDYEYMKNRHGGGKYELWVKNRNRTERSSASTVFKMRLDIPISEVDPKLNIKELEIEHPVNKSYIQMLVNQGKMTRTGKILEAPEASKGSGLESLVEKLVDRMSSMNEAQLYQARSRAPEDQAVQKAIELAAKGGERSIEFMLEMIKNQKDPLELALKLMAVMQPQQAPSTDGISMKDLIMLMDTQRKEQADMFRLMMEQNNRRNDDDEDDISKFSKQAASFAKLSELFGGGRMAKPAWYESALEHIGPVLGEGFKLINNIVLARSVGANQAQAAAVAQQQANRNPKYPEPRTIDKNAQALPQPEPIENPMPTQEPNEFHMMLDAYGGLILNAIGRNDSGDMFADNVANLTSIGDVQRLQDMGPEAILATMKSHELFWQNAMARFSERTIVTFVQEFCAYHPDDDSDDDDSELDSETSIKPKGGVVTINDKPKGK